tara:strand:- start:9 stop:1868 length:1860 start_codon:yes stop_codon:yes gene_type:complete
MSKLEIKGFDITIENKIGTTRKGVDEDGNHWSTLMKNSYGFFDNTKGADGDEVDVFIGPNIEEDFNVFVVNQSTGNPRSFDEHKVMFGFKDEMSAKSAYMDNYQSDWEGFDNIVEFTLVEFSKWIKTHEMINPAINKLDKKVMQGAIKKISLNGPVDTDVTLNDLIAQAGDVSLFKTLVLDIGSQGGCVEEGLKIMIWLDGLSQDGKEIITVVSANAYSIASLIMLAADKRYISKHGEVMVHNPMVPFIEYANANELEKHVAELRSLEEMLQTLYMNFANISIEDIKNLMDNETYLSPDEAVLRGFADEVIDVKPKPYAMMAIKKDLNMSKLNVRNQLNVVIAALNGASVVNQMYYNTKGDEIQIFQSNPAKYAKEDKTSLEAGEVRLSDGTMLEIKNFEIVNITKEVETETPVVAEDAIPEGEVKTEELAPVAEVVKEDVANPVAENNVGPAPEEILTKAVAQAIDKPLAVVADTVATVADVPVVAVDPIEPVVAVEEVPAAPVEEVIAAVEEGQEIAPDVNTTAVEEEVITDDTNAHEEAMKSLELKISDLLARIELLEGNSENADADMKAAAEAIDTLARNTSSAFKPEARKVSKANDSSAPDGLSLFQRMRFNKK